MKLKPCPFCGGEAELWDNKLEYSFYSVICKECDCMTPYGVTRGEAVEVWNTRKPLEDIVEQLEELKTPNKSMSKTESILRRRNFEDAIEIVKSGGKV